jgi:hypothetical protein
MAPVPWLDDPAGCRDRERAATRMPDTSWCPMALGLDDGWPFVERRSRRT